MKFVEHRVADRRVVRLIQKWLNAGVLEQGKRIRSEVGTVQGGSISPLLSNLYLHYVLDLWIQQWRQKQVRGEMIFVRFADDFVVGFQHRHEAERFLAELRERFAKFRLELHADKTRIVEFGRYAEPNRRRRGDGKPETLLRCNYLMQGVRVPAGTHDVEFRFAPPLRSLYVSLAGIAFALLLAGVLAVVPRGPKQIVPQTAAPVPAKKAAKVAKV